MPTDPLTRILQQLDSRLGRYRLLDQYAAGEAPITFVSPDVREQLNNRLARVSINIPGLLVNSLAERLRIAGFDGADIMADWTRNGMAANASALHREVLTLGEAYAIVWAGEDGSPQVTVESPKLTTAFTNPATGEVVLAVKRWEVADGAKAGTWACLYGPDKVDLYRCPTLGAQTYGFELVSSLDNPLGVVPVVRFTNGGRIGDAAASEMADVLPLTDALTKLTTDMLVTSEAIARPRRWATGLELAEDEETGAIVSPIAEGDKLMVSESPETKFGQLPGSDLMGHQNAITMTLRLISAATGLPDHALGIGGENPSSADAIRASEASLTARAEAKQLAYGRSWAQVAALIVAVRDDVDPSSVVATPRWADPSTRSVAQEADAALKLVQAGVISVDEARQRLGIEGAAPNVRTSSQPAVTFV